MVQLREVTERPEAAIRLEEDLMGQEVASEEAHHPPVGTVEAEEDMVRLRQV